MLSLLNSIDSSFTDFFYQLTESLGFAGYFALILGIEVLFIVLFVIRTIYSYEARLKRSLDSANKWLFKNKKLDTNNIKNFNNIIKNGPKRLVYYWRQYILYRDGDPSMYLSEENLIEKPLKTSAWGSNITNLGILTGVWAVISFLLGLASQINQGALEFPSVILAMVFPAMVVLIGVLAIIGMKEKRVMNLDNLYHIYHIFARFLNNACADLTPYLDFNLLFTEKELANGNPELREYYEARARKIKEELENAIANDKPHEVYSFENVGVDGTLLLDRAMKESEDYISVKTATLSQIAQIEAQKDSLRKNYENVQMDLQRKIQTAKENIQKLIEEQASTTSRFEVGLLRQKQDKEKKKQEALQKDYDQEEKRYISSRTELDKEIEQLKKQLDTSLEKVQKGMSAEYQTFFGKVMKSAYQVAEQKVKDEKEQLASEKDKNEKELIIVQTQIKRLKDENDTLRERLAQYDSNYMRETENVPEQGHYDENGNYIYSDGSYHDANGLYHDVDGKVYNMNGELVSEDISPEEQQKLDEEALKNSQIDAFGGYIDEDNNLQMQGKNQDSEEQIDQSEIYQENDDDAQYTSEEIEENADENESDEQTYEEQELEDLPQEAEGQITDEEITEEQPVEEMQQGQEEAINTENEENEEEKPKRKRGRPRKVVSEDEKPSQPKKRGRPRKIVAEEEKASSEPKKRGRPRKSEQETAVKSKTTSSTKKKASQSKSTKPKTSNSQSAKDDMPAKKRGRPRKTTPATQTVETASAPKKRGRPRKQTGETSSSFIDKINELISQEENKLKNMKAFLNSEIDQALKPEEKNNIDQEKDDIMNAVESLKEQASKAKANGQSEELSKVNRRIEDLINELSNINSDETDDTTASGDKAE